MTHQAFNNWKPALKWVFIIRYVSSNYSDCNFHLWNLKPFYVWTDRVKLNFSNMTASLRYAWSLAPESAAKWSFHGCWPQPVCAQEMRILLRQILDRTVKLPAERLTVGRHHSLATSSSPQTRVPSLRPKQFSIPPFNIWFLLLSVLLSDHLYTSSTSILLQVGVNTVCEWKQSRVSVSFWLAVGV